MTDVDHTLAVPVSEVSASPHMPPPAVETVKKDEPMRHEDSPASRTWDVKMSGGTAAKPNLIRVQGALHDIHAVRKAAEAKSAGNKFISAEEVYPSIRPAP